MQRFSLPEIFLVWVVGIGTGSILLKQRIASLARLIPLPCLVMYGIIATPLILLEEALTIEVPYFWGVLPRLAAFYILFLPLYIIQRFTKCSYITASLLFGIGGWINEFLLVGRIHLWTGLVLWLMSLFCFLIYAVLALLPSYYLQEILRRNGAGSQRA